MKKILIETIDEYEWAAMAEDGRLVDLIVEHRHSRSIAGNIYVGLVRNILPSQFAFIDIGQPKNGFLNLTEHKAGVIKIKAGDSVLVQARKDPSGEKGASLSTRLDITGRFTVLFESGGGEMGISHKITGTDERARLRKILRAHLPKGFGAILRTDSEKKDEKDIAADLRKTLAIYKTLRETGIYQKPPALLYRENSALGELLREDVDEIILCDSERLTAVRSEVENRLSGAGCRVKLAEGGFPADLKRQAQRALEKRIWLRCGGSITFEQTEACVIIDVNSGKFAGVKNHRESIRTINLEAAKETAAQIRLRNLSGMIIIDFINMDEQEDIKALYGYFSSQITKDRIKVNIIGMTELGLMQLTRRKTRDSLNRILFRECPVCQGEGFIRR
ncbi:MAG: ribonuclease E/G [Clostridiales bacterium]|nr:ribonuclease E/G [Clostridiales bacterium]